jgi:F-type H+-transporting ATPase subunit alpha
MPTDPARTELLVRQAAWLESYRFEPRIAEIGQVVSVGDGVVWIQGLPSAGMDDLLLLEDGSQVVVFHLSETSIGGILLHETPQLTAGTPAHLTTRRLSIPVGDTLLGRIIDPLGNPLDGQPPPEPQRWRSLETQSPPILARDFVNEPLYTGIKIIDTLIPIGKGQRQLIIGDEGTGRSALAIDTVINQRGKNTYCVYVLIGQKRSAVIDIVETLRRHGALDYTVLVVAEASALPGLNFYAPFAGCAIAEAWMEHGKDTLVIYDDLSAHARSYRELSLLLRRPPGREAYPGDIFYVHARLLERATCLAPGHGGGSMTALPIIQTQQGEIAAYIPTNLISITDGQLYLDQHLFAAGFRPAIDIRRSVSRIGGKAQHSRIKREAGHIKLDYLQFLELEVFTRFGARLESSMEVKIQRGRVLREILKQERLKPVPARFQMAWLLAYNEGLFDAFSSSAVAGVLEHLAEQLDQSPLSLDDERAQWLEALKRWLETELRLEST